MRRLRFLPYVSIIISFRCSTYLDVTVWVIVTIIWWIELLPNGCVRNHIHDQEREVQCFKREPLDQEVYQAGLSSIHINAVADVVNHSSMNAILGVNLHSLQPKKVGCLDKTG